MKSTARIVTLTAVCLVCELVWVGSALAGRPGPWPSSLKSTWRPSQPENFEYATSRESASRRDQSENELKGAVAGTEKAGKLAEVASKAMDFQKTLSATDDRLKPKYEPPGAPGVPSKCLEDKACRPCYKTAYDKINKTRGNLEKVRAHYDYTHRFSTDGLALMNGVAATAGGPAMIGAAVQTESVNDAVKAFDVVVARKNRELLSRLQGELKDVNACEAKYYKNDDWYDRFGYIYFQFMSAHYGYADKHGAAP